MNCPVCNWPRISRRIVDGVEHRYCLHADCDWSEETVPGQKPIVKHHREPGRPTGDLLGGWFLERVLGRRTR